MAKEVKVSNIIRKLYVEANGNLLEIKDHIDPNDYPKDTTVYVKEAAKGANKGEKLYAVAVADFIPKKRVSTAMSVQSMLASGMSADDIVKKLAGNA